MLLVTRKQTIGAGVPEGAWRKARRDGRLKPIGKKFYRRGRYFMLREVSQVFGLPDGWELGT